MNDEAQTKTDLIKRHNLEWDNQLTERADTLALTMELDNDHGLTALAFTLLAGDDDNLGQSLKGLRNIALFSSSQQFRSNAAQVVMGVAPESITRAGTLHDTFYALDAVCSSARPGSHCRNQALSLMVDNVGSFAPEDHAFGRYYAKLTARHAGAENEEIKASAEQAAAAFAAMENPRNVIWVRPSFEVALTLAR